MANITATSDNGLLDLLRQNGPLGISSLAAATKVTPTAVRQRLNRLMGQGLIERETARAGRGRPSHRYSITPQGQRSAGTNFADLAVALWQEIRAVKDVEVRRGLFQRLAKSLAGLYERQIEGTTAEERMHSVAALFSERNVPLIVEYPANPAIPANRKRERPELGAPDDHPAAVPPPNTSPPAAPPFSPSLPVLTALACPYPELAEQDRGVCAMERMLFEHIIGTGVRLTECRLDGASRCTFAISGEYGTEVGSPSWM